MKDKFLIFLLILVVGAILFVYLNKKEVEELEPTSKAYEKNVIACSNAAIDISGFQYKLEGGVSQTGVESSVLKFANHSTKGIIDNGPVNDLVCIYDLSSFSYDKKTYLSVLFGLTNNEFVQQGSLLLGEGVTVKTLKILNNKVYVSYSDANGNNIEKVVIYDGDLISFQDIK